jgi:hypothetical protein
VMSENLLNEWKAFFNQATSRNEAAFNHFKNQLDQFSKVLEIAQKDVTSRIIETSAQGQNGVIKYKTTLEADGDLTNEFPNPAPDPKDVYWERHNQLVDGVLSLQKEIINKVIDSVGQIAMKVVTPISVSSSDLVTLAQLFIKPKP